MVRLFLLSHSRTLSSHLGNFRNGICSPCLDVPERDRIRANAEKTPFFTDRLRETNDC